MNQNETGTVQENPVDAIEKLLTETAELDLKIFKSALNAGMPEEEAIEDVRNKRDKAQAFYAKVEKMIHIQSLLEAMTQDLGQ